jgi:hypothetical protein
MHPDSIRVHSKLTARSILPRLFSVKPGTESPERSVGFVHNPSPLDLGLRRQLLADGGPAREPRHYAPWSPAT